MSLILALDQGTTSSRAILFDESSSIIASAQKEFEQIFPQTGWVEHDPREIWSSQIQVAHRALSQAGLKAKDIAAIGITNQRETALLWNRKTGEPVHNAIVWQDRRTSSMCDEYKQAGHTELIQQKTGLVIDAYFAGSKLRWLLDNVPGARKSAEAGELAFGTVDSWLLWNLTNGAIHVTDVTNASRTMLFNIKTGDWDDELLELFHIPRSVLPEVKSSSEVYCETAAGIFDSPVPVAGIAGDQQSALFGQNCYEHGMAKNTYGTGCFMLMNIGQKVTLSQHKLLTTVAWKTGGQTEYAFEGSVFIAGAVVQWLRDGLGIIKSSPEVEELASRVPDNGGIYLVPAFAGLGAPHWDQYARGTMVGITRGTNASHIARAALEGIAFQSADILDVMKDDSGIPINELRVDGGASANNLLMQIQADLLQAPVVRPKNVETTALGAAYLAGLAVGYWKTRDDIRHAWQVDRIFEPQISADEALHLRKRWKDALERAKNWEQ